MSTGPIEEPSYELVMPFIVCQTQGGPYDDDSFVAGWALGVLDVELGQAALDRRHHTQTVRTASLPQAELLAMKHSYGTAVEECEDAEGWSTVTFLVPSLEEVP